MCSKARQITSAGSIRRLKANVVSSGNQFNFLKLKPNLTAIGTNYFFRFQDIFIYGGYAIVIIPLAFCSEKERGIAVMLLGIKLKRANKLARKYLSKPKRP